MFTAILFSNFNRALWQQDSGLLSMSFSFIRYIQEHENNYKVKKKIHVQLGLYILHVTSNILFGC